MTVNIRDPEATIQTYFRSQGFTMKTAAGALAAGGQVRAVLNDYGVRAFPTNYLIDRQGRVAWRGVGFNEPALRAALASHGLTAR